MSEEAPPNPIPTPDTFNSGYFFDKNGGLSYDTASKYFLRLSGGTVGFINSSLYMYNGSALDFSAISGITPGTISASKAVIVDANKDISAFRNLTATGTLSGGSLSLTGTSPMLNLAAPTGVNNSMVWTGGAQPTTTNGLGLGFSPMTSTGRIRCYNYITSSFNNLDINDSAIYVKGSNSNVGIGTSTLSAGKKLTVAGDTDIVGNLSFSGVGFTASQYLSITAGTANASKALVLSSSKDIGVIRRITGQYINLQGGGTTDDFSNQGRLVNAIDSSMGNGTSRYITLGKAFSSRNSGEIAYVHSSDGSDDNRLSLGGYGFSDTLSVFGNSTVAIGSISRSNARLYVGSGVGDSTIAGSAQIEILSNTSLTQQLAPLTVSNPSIRTVGNVIVGGTLYVSSDRRLKKEIVEIPLDDAKRFVYMCMPRRFVLRANPMKPEFGYIAQEVLHAGLSELADAQPDEEMLFDGDEFDLRGFRWNVSYDRVCALLHTYILDMDRTMQQLVKQVEEQQATIDALVKRCG